MSLEVNISFRVEGSFTEGFTMTPMIPQQGSQEFRELGSLIRLPARPALLNLYNECKNFINEHNTRIIERVPNQTTTRKRWINTQESLNKSFLDWIRNANFEVSINEIITRIFNRRLTDISVRIHFVSNNSNNSNFVSNNDGYDIFRRMPWDEFTRNTRSRMKFVLSQYSLSYNSCPTRLSELRILVIRGGRDLENSQNREINALRQIPGIRLIDETRTIDNVDCLHDLLTKNVYDILFYTGHSSSNNGGEIRVGSLTVPINVFVEDLRIAVSRGLKIALFNSCDGLGIADFLVTQVRVPVVLVMKEPVPDIFAAKFFIEFITKFAADRMSLSIALEKARSSSHYESVNFPGATSLPILFYLFPVKKDFRISRFLYIKVVIYKIIKDSFLGVWKKLNNMFGIIQRLSRRQYMYMLIFLLALFSAVVLTIGILKSKNYPLEGVMNLTRFTGNIVDIDISDDEQYVAYVDNGGISLQKISLQNMDDINNYSPLCQIDSLSQNGTVTLNRLVFKDKETLAIATPKLSNSLEIRFFNVYNCPKPHEGGPVTIQTEYEYNNIISLDFSTDKRVILVTTNKDTDKEQKNPTTTRLYDSESGRKIDIQVKDQNGSFNQDSLFNHVVDAKFLDSQKIILLKNKDKNISLEIYKYSPDKNNDNNSWNRKLELGLIHSEPLETEDPQKIVLSQDRKYISILGPGPIHIWEIDDKFKLKEIPKSIQDQLGGRTDVRDAIFYKKQILIPNTTSVD